MCDSSLATYRQMGVLVLPKTRALEFDLPNTHSPVLRSWSELCRFVAEHVVDHWSWLQHVVNAVVVHEQPTVRLRQKWRLVDVVVTFWKTSAPSIGPLPDVPHLDSAVALRGAASCAHADVASAPASEYYAVFRIRNQFTVRKHDVLTLIPNNERGMVVFAPNTPAMTRVVSQADRDNSWLGRVCSANVDLAGADQRVIYEAFQVTDVERLADSALYKDSLEQTRDSITTYYYITFADHPPMVTGPVRVGRLDSHWLRQRALYFMAGHIMSGAIYRVPDKYTRDLKEAHGTVLVQGDCEIGMGSDLESFFPDIRDVLSKYDHKWCELLPRRTFSEVTLVSRRMCVKPEAFEVCDGFDVSFDVGNWQLQVAPDSQAFWVLVWWALDTHEDWRVVYCPYPPSVHSYKFDFVRSAVPSQLGSILKNPYFEPLRKLHLQKRVQQVHEQIVQFDHGKLKIKPDKTRFFPGSLFVIDKDWSGDVKTSEFLVPKNTRLYCWESPLLADLVEYALVEKHADKYFLLELDMTTIPWDYASLRMDHGTLLVRQSRWLAVKSAVKLTNQFSSLSQELQRLPQTHHCSSTIRSVIIVPTTKTAPLDTYIVSPITIRFHQGVYLINPRTKTLALAALKCMRRQQDAEVMHHNLLYGPLMFFDDKNTTIVQTSSLGNIWTSDVFAPVRAIYHRERMQHVHSQLLKFDPKSLKAVPESAKRHRPFPHDMFWVGRFPPDWDQTSSSVLSRSHIFSSDHPLLQRQIELALTSPYADEYHIGQVDMSDWSPVCGFPTMINKGRTRFRVTNLVKLTVKYQALYNTLQRLPVLEPMIGTSSNVFLLPSTAVDKELFEHYFIKHQFDANDGIFMLATESRMLACEALRLMRLRVDAKAKFDHIIKSEFQPMDLVEGQTIDAADSMLGNIWTGNDFAPVRALYYQELMQKAHVDIMKFDHASLKKVPEEEKKRPFPCCMFWVGTLDDMQKPNRRMLFVLESPVLQSLIESWLVSDRVDQAYIGQVDRQELADHSLLEIDCGTMTINITIDQTRAAKLTDRFGELKKELDKLPSANIHRNINYIVLSSDQVNPKLLSQKEEQISIDCPISKNIMIIKDRMLAPFVMRLLRQQKNAQVYYSYHSVDIPNLSPCLLHSRTKQRFERSSLDNIWTSNAFSDLRALYFQERCRSLSHAVLQHPIKLKPVRVSVANSPSKPMPVYIKIHFSDCHILPVCMGDKWLVEFDQSKAHFYLSLQESELTHCDHNNRGGKWIIAHIDYMKNWGQDGVTLCLLKVLKTVFHPPHDQ